MQPQRVKIRSYMKLPPNSKKVTRGSRWGNPYILFRHGGQFNLEESLIRYTKWLDRKLSSDPTFLDPLKGFDLGCYCDIGSPCHADILLERVLLDE